MAVMLQQLAWDILQENYTVNPTTAPPSKTVPKAWKLGILPALFLITLVPSIGPWFMMCMCRKRNLALTFSFAGCLASGILLGAGLGNILPEAIENWQGISNRLSGFPFASSIAGIVVLLLVSLEHLLVSAGASHAHGPEDDDDLSDDEKPGEETPIIAATLKAQAAEKEKERQEKEGHSHGEKKAKEKHGRTHSHSEKMPEHSETKEGHKPHEHKVPEWHNNQEHHHHQRRIITVVVFSIAFCLHGLADGLALGATNERGAFIALVAAAFSHKFLDGFALGVPVQKAELPWTYTAGILCFASAMTPIGILIGMALTSANEAGSYLARAIILSFSFGSFLFLSLLELLPQSLSAPRKHKVLKLVFVFFGFVAMTCLATLEDRSQEQV